MSFSVQETLFSLLHLNAVSGHENSVAEVMLREFTRQAKEVWRDRLGNVVARYGSDNPNALRLMMFAHMDEVGFMVRKIEPSGFALQAWAARRRSPCPARWSRLPGITAR